MLGFSPFFMSMYTKISRQSSVLRRSQIIDAAINLITEKGMEFVTIDAIADEVGLTEGAIYRHFTSKKQILTSVIEEIESNLLQTIHTAKQRGSSPIESLEFILEAHLSDVESRRAASFIIISEAMGFDGIGLSPRVSLMLTNYLRFLEQCISEGITGGTIRPEVDKNAAATAFLGLIQSTATMWALNDHSTKLAARREQMWDIYKRGICNGH